MANPTSRASSHSSLPVHSPSEPPARSTLCQRITRIFLQVINTLARIFCCWENSKITPSSKSAPTPSPTSNPTPPEAPQDLGSRVSLKRSSSSSSSSLSFPSKLNPATTTNPIPPEAPQAPSSSRVSAKRSSSSSSTSLPPSPKTNLIEGVWHEPKVLIVSENSTQNPIEDLFSYEEDISKLLNQRKRTILDTSINGTTYCISRPQEGTLQIQSNNALWTIETKEMNDKSIPTCSINSEDSIESSQILSVLQELHLRMATYIKTIQRNEQIQNDLSSELLSTLWKFAISNLAAPCHRSKGIEITIPSLQNPELKQKIRVKMGSANNPRLHGCPLYRITFQAIPSEELLTLIFDEQGYLTKISTDSLPNIISTKKFFGNEELWSQQIRTLVGELLVSQTTTVNDENIQFHPLALKLNPLSILRRLTINDNGELKNYRAKPLNDEFQPSGSVDAGGPMRQFISELSRYFLSGHPSLPFAMPFGLPQARPNASMESVENACKYLAALIAYCHSQTAPNNHSPIIMGRVLNDLFFEIIRHINVFGFLHKDLSDESLLFNLIKITFPVLHSALPTITIRRDTEMPSADVELDAEGMEIDPKAVSINSTDINEALLYYDEPSNDLMFEEQYKVVIYALVGIPGEDIPEDFDSKAALKEFLIEEFGSIMRTIQLIAQHLPQEVINAIANVNSIDLYSERIQGQLFNREEIANRIRIPNSIELRQKAEWIQEFIRDPKQSEQWVKNFLLFITGAPNLPQGQNILINTGRLGKACEPHTCSFTLDVPLDHPRIGLPKGTQVDDKTAFFHHIDYCIHNGAVFTKM